MYSSLRPVHPLFKLLIIITDDPGYNFDGAMFDNIESVAGLPPNIFVSLIYSTRGECIMIITSIFI